MWYTNLICNEHQNVTVLLYYCSLYYIKYYYFTLLLSLRLKPNLSFSSLNSSTSKRFLKFPMPNELGKGQSYDMPVQNPTGNYFFACTELGHQFYKANMYGALTFYKLKR